MFAAISSFFVAVLTAMVVENALFSRALSSSKIYLTLSGKKLWLFGGAVTFLNVVSGILCYIANRILVGLEVPLLVRSLVFLIATCIVYNCIVLVLIKWKPGLYSELGEPLLQAAFNSAVFGTLLVSASYNYGFFGFVGFGLGAGIGLTIALLIVEMGREYLSISDIPKIFRGLPITFLYIGIMSLAIYGLIGHQLPM